MKTETKYKIVIKPEDETLNGPSIAIPLDEAREADDKGLLRSYIETLVEQLEAVYNK